MDVKKLVSRVLVSVLPGPRITSIWVTGPCTVEAEGMQIDLDTVRRALALPLPGLEAQMRMATRPRSTAAEFSFDGAARQGSVLIALYPRDGQLWLPLTRRSAHLAHHKGQISFPGGRREDGDASLWQTALREAHEEIGLEPSALELLGELSELYIAASHFCVVPHVGVLAGPPVFRMDPLEVDGLIEMPLGLILDPHAKREETWEWRGRPTQVPYYSYGDHVIWGATAMMLSEFESLLRQAVRLEPS